MPGTAGAVRSAAEAQAFARGAGFPVMLKAVAGGGGKGMRRVERATDLAAAFEAASSEALRAFGNASQVAVRRAVLPAGVGGCGRQ